MYAHLHDQPPSATARRSELPPGVDQVIEKAMAKRPVDRYPTAGELAAAFKDATIGDRPPRRTRSNTKTWLAVTGAVIAVGVALAFVALTRGQDDPGSGEPSPAAAASALPAGSLAKIDPDTADASLVIRGAPGPQRDDEFRPNLAIGEGGAWMQAWPDVTANPLLQHFDEATGEPRDQISFPWGGSSFGLAVGSRTVWFSGAVDVSRVSRINPATHDPLQPVSIGSGIVTDIVLGGGSLWVGSSDGTLTAIDPLTGRRLDEIEIDGTPDALAYGSGSVWALDLLEGEVIRVDPINRRVLARISGPRNVRDIAAGDGGIWVLDPVAGTATPIDPLPTSPAPPSG